MAEPAEDKSEEPKEFKRGPIDPKFITRTKLLRLNQEKELQEAEAKFGRRLDFTGYLQGKDPEYLGIINKTDFAKPFGNDSSSLQAVLGGNSYWRRITSRADVDTNPALSQIKNMMDPVLTVADRPHVHLSSKGERLTFFNTLANKYHDGRGESVPVKTKPHRSSKAEVAFIMSNLYRRDRDLVIHTEY